MPRFYKRGCCLTGIKPAASIRGRLGGHGRMISAPDFVRESGRDKKRQNVNGKPRWIITVMGISSRFIRVRNLSQNHGKGQRGAHTTGSQAHGR